MDKKNAFCKAYVKKKKYSKSGPLQWTKCGEVVCSP